MPIQIMQDQRRGVRVIEFTGQIVREDLETVSRLYTDRDFYRFEDREVVLFAPDASLAAIDVEDLSLLADSYIEALHQRGDQTAVLSAWVIGDHVRAEIRLWWEFSRDHSRLREPRSVVSSLEDALSALGLPEDWADDLRARQGCRIFEDTGPATG
ncbi:hypothetical protein [Devosia sp.]|uniref:hypothetical protein n=1 Tax=Devosia sp. TaxID=1871048 RepID=UPI003A947ECF